MATNILDKYGIKEVADVMFYEMDSKGAPSAPVLYLDTLKVSTLNQSSEKVDATGGKGNVKQLTWDTNKEITLELEDALFSAKSLAIMFGGTITEKESGHVEVLKTLKVTDFTALSSPAGTFSFKIKDGTFYLLKEKMTFFKYAPNDANVPTITPIAPGSGTTFPEGAEWVTFDLLDATTTASGSTAAVTKGMEIDITSEFDSNTYYITGDTFARNAQSGQDEFLQMIIPKGKVSAEDVSLTMEADGDPSTFSMTVDCLKSASGSMLKFVKYGISGLGGADGKNKGVASVLDDYNGSVATGVRDAYVDGMGISGTSLDEGSNIDG